MSLGRKLVPVVALLSMVATGCEFDPTAATTPEASGCDGLAGTLGFGFHEDLDPHGGSTYVGTEGDDVIVISGGPVTVNALGGDDVICVNDVFATAPDAKVVIDGGEGNDTIIGSVTTHEVCTGESTSNCDEGTIAGDELCEKVVDYEATMVVTLTADVHCPSKGLETINSSAQPLDIDITIDLNGHSFTAAFGDAVTTAGLRLGTKVGIANGTLDRVDQSRSELTLTDVTIDYVYSIDADLLILDTTVNGRVDSRSSGTARIERSTIGSANGITQGDPLVLIDTDVVSDGVIGAIEMTGGSVSGAQYGYRGVGNQFGTVGRFTDVEFFDNDWALYSVGDSSGLTLADSLVRNNRIGVEVGSITHGDVVITNTTIEHNSEAGVASQFTQSVTFDGSWIRHNGFGTDGTAQNDAIFVWSPRTFTIIDSIISDNAGRAINFVLSSHPNPPDYTVTSSLIGNNGLPGCGELPCYP